MTQEKGDFENLLNNLLANKEPLNFSDRKKKEDIELDFDLNVENKELDDDEFQPKKAVKKPKKEKKAAV